MSSARLGRIPQRLLSPLCWLMAIGVVSVLWACGSLDEDPKEGFNALRNVPNPTVVKEAKASDSCDGGVVPDASACEAAFAKDIVPIFERATCFKAGNCHGGPAKPQMPRNDLKATWENLRAKQNPNLKLPYLNTCSTDPTQSYIIANLKKDNGGFGMPVNMDGLDLDLTTAELATVEKWVKCGAPFN